MSVRDTINIIAPGRVCLFGEHQDYLGLPVIACAINRYIQLTARPNGKNYFAIDMVDINQKRIIPVSETFDNLQKRDYFASALRVLRRRSCTPTSGYDIHITGNIPINSGTSSSSALLLAWIRFLIAAFGIDEKISPELLSYIAYESEVLEHNEPGGMMDHYAIGVGNIVHITTQKPFKCRVIGNQVTGLITGVSGIKKDTVGLIGNLKKHSLGAIEKIKQQIPDFDLLGVQIHEIENYTQFLTPLEKPYFGQRLRAIIIQIGFKGIARDKYQLATNRGLYECSSQGTQRLAQNNYPNHRRDDSCCFRGRGLRRKNRRFGGWWEYCSNCPAR